MKLKKYTNSIIILLFISFVLVGCSRNKIVVIREFEEYKKRTLLEDCINEIRTTFRRPALTIDFIVDENFNKEDLKNVIEDLKPVINDASMDKVANMYWVKGSKVATAYVNFYTDKIDKKDLRKNLKYSLYTNYLKKHNVGEIPENIDGYNTWYVDINNEELLLNEYLNNPLLK